MAGGGDGLQDRSGGFAKHLIKMNFNYQYSHYSHDESDTVRNVTGEEVMQAFDDFDWYGESEKANELQKCSPTLSVIIDLNSHLIWVSSYGDKNNIQFVSECKIPGRDDLDTQAFSIDDARKAFEYFINEEFDQLKRLYQKV